MGRRNEAGGSRAFAGWIALACIGLISLSVVSEGLRDLATHRTAITSAVVGVLALLAYGWLRGEDTRQAHTLAVASLESTDTMSGTEFEQWCADLLRARGFRSVAVCGTSGDRGIDVTALDPRGRAVVVQCKRRVSKVGAPAMRQFIGAIAVSKADVGMFLTNSTFTAEAAAIATDQRVVLVDRSALEAWLTELPRRDGRVR